MDYQWWVLVIVLFFAIIFLIFFKLNRKKDIESEIAENEIKYCDECMRPLNKVEVEKDLFFYKCPECSSINMNGTNVKKLEQKLKLPDSVDFSKKFMSFIVNS